MRLLILAAIVALPAASASSQGNQYPKARDSMRADCPRPPGRQYALKPGDPLKPRKLGELPPAEGYQAVLRIDEKGCLDPLLVKDRIRQSR
jgi:hypothetical protein